eukprot:GHVN01081893.1.p1 GENE.GHVN01081893.1~~GHVN01081893.1.p1  ORF type:complete len:190 (+),score=26.82 GHVN01081893.1:36-605(+)
MLRWLITCLAVTTSSHFTHFFCEGYDRHVASNLPWTLIGPWEGWGMNPPILPASGILSQSNSPQGRRSSHSVLAGSCTTLPLFISTSIPPNLKYDEASRGIHVHVDSRPYQQQPGARLRFDSAGVDSNPDGGEDYNISPHVMSRYPSLVTPMRVPLESEASSAPQSPFPSLTGVNPPKLGSYVRSSEAT